MLSGTVGMKLFGSRLCRAAVVGFVVVGVSGWLATLSATKTAYRRVRLPAAMIETFSPYTLDGTPRCTVRQILLVAVPQHVTDITGSVEHKGTGLGGPFDDLLTYGPGFTNPITGYGPNYRVARGEVGWFTGGGSGPGPCESGLGQWLHAKGFGLAPANLVPIRGRLVDGSGVGIANVAVQHLRPGQRHGHERLIRRLHCPGHPRQVYGDRLAPFRLGTRHRYDDSLRERNRVG